MTRIARWGAAWLSTDMIVAGLTGVAYAHAAPPGAVVCFSPALAAGPSGGPGGAPATSLALTTGAPGPGVPRIALLAPQPATGALVVPVITPLPSVPGVSLLHLEVLVPPAPSLRRDVSLEAAQLLPSVLAAAGSPGAPGRFVASCF